MFTRRGVREKSRDKAKEEGRDLDWEGPGRTLDFILRAMGMILSRGVKLYLDLKRSLWDVVGRMCVGWNKTSGRKAS